MDVTNAPNLSTHIMLSDGRSSSACQIQTNNIAIHYHRSCNVTTQGPLTGYGCRRYGATPTDAAAYKRPTSVEAAQSSRVYEAFLTSPL